jgi:hypothetical protein
MDDADRFRLLGSYRTPRFRIGQRVRCLVRGEVVITGMTEAPIPWPIAMSGRGALSLIGGRSSAEGESRTDRAGRVIIAPSTGRRMTRLDTREASRPESGPTAPILALKRASIARKAQNRQRTEGGGADGPLCGWKG